MPDIKMTSQKPYLIPALYEWILDNNCTPYIAINTQYKGVKIPKHLYNNTQLVLNIAPSAINGMQSDLEALSFNARFNAVSHKIYLPFGAINTIFAQETGQGMVFMWEENETPPNDEPPSPPPPSPKPKNSKTKDTNTKKPALRLVK